MYLHEYTYMYIYSINTHMFVSIQKFLLLLPFSAEIYTDLLIGSKPISFHTVDEEIFQMHLNMKVQAIGYLPPLSSSHFCCEHMKSH